MKFALDCKNLNLVMNKSLGLFLLTLQLVIVSSENVLMLLPFSPRSHKIIVDPIATALAKKGHRVTFVSTFVSENPRENVTEIVLNQFTKYNGQIRELLVDSVLSGWDLSIVTRYYAMHKEQCEKFYKTDILRQLISGEMKFKVVLMDCAFTECLLPMWRKFAQHLIVLSTSPIPPLANKVMSIPTPYSIVPYMLTSFTHNMNFGQRFLNTLYWLLSTFVVYHGHKFIHENVILPNFPDIKGYDESIQNISLILANEDPVLSRPRPYLSKVILIGGIKCRAPRPLPESDLKKFIDDSDDNGFILVSFGSTINGNAMSERLITTLVSSFAQIKQRVVWKFENKINGLSHNVKTMNWIPQEDILGHSKIKAFINIGGISSLHDGLYNAVPQISFPMTSDQPALAAVAADIGVGIRLDFRTVTVEELVSAINKASFDVEMRNKVKYYSEIFRSRKENPSDAAVFWIELVMKFNGAHHLRSAAEDLNILQYYLVDVYAFFFAVTAFLGYMYWISMKKIIAIAYARILGSLMVRIRVKQQ